MHGPTTVVNVTGSVLVEVTAPPDTVDVQELRESGISDDGGWTSS
jgi:hypothetical protein